MPRIAFVYLLRCADNTIYIGRTYNIPQRVDAHQQGKGARYTRTRRPVRLAYSEPLPSRRDAMRREMLLKRWSRARKLALIAQGKPRRKRKTAKPKMTGAR